MVHISESVILSIQYKFKEYRQGSLNLSLNIIVNVIGIYLKNFLKQIFVKLVKVLNHA